MFGKSSFKNKNKNIAREKKMSLQSLLEEIQTLVNNNSNISSSVHDNFTFCFSSSSPFLISALVKRRQKIEKASGMIFSSSSLKYNIILIENNVELVPLVVAFVLSLLARNSTLHMDNSCRIRFCDLSFASNRNNSKDEAE